MCRWDGCWDENDNCKVWLLSYFSLVEKRWAGTAAMISALFLVMGVVSGVNFSLSIGKIIQAFWINECKEKKMIFYYIITTDFWYIHVNASKYRVPYGEIDNYIFREIFNEFSCYYCYSYMLFIYMLSTKAFTKLSLFCAHLFKILDRLEYIIPHF